MSVYEPVVNQLYVLSNPDASNMPRDSRNHICVVMRMDTNYVYFAVKNYNLDHGNPSGFWECGRDNFASAFTPYSDINKLGNFPRKWGIK
jgi:hypothetical protein